MIGQIRAGGGGPPRNRPNMSRGSSHCNTSPASRRACIAMGTPRCDSPNTSEKVVSSLRLINIGGGGGGGVRATRKPLWICAWTACAYYSKII